MPLAFALPITASVSRRSSADDSVLLAEAAAADALRKTRHMLRRRARGREPAILDAAVYAAKSGLPVDPDPSKWRRVCAARNEVTVRWMWLVEIAAKKVISSYTQSRAPMAFADMVQEGMCGLMHAVERYSPDRDYAFDKFAYFYVKYAILNAITAKGSLVRLPTHVHRKLSRLNKAHKRLEDPTCARTPTLDEIAAEAGITPDEARLYVNRNRKILSLDSPPKGRSDGPTLYQPLRDPTEDCERQLEIFLAREAISRFVHSAGLKDLELAVVMLKYGLADGIERLLGDVSRMLNVECDVARGAERRALYKLRKQAKNDTAAWAELLFY